MLQASAIAEAKLKMSDVHCAVYLCSLIHQRYASFATFLLENFQKYHLTKKDEGKVGQNDSRVLFLHLFYVFFMCLFMDLLQTLRSLNYHV